MSRSTSGKTSNAQILDVVKGRPKGEVNATLFVEIQNIKNQFKVLQDTIQDLLQNPGQNTDVDGTENAWIPNPGAIVIVRNNTGDALDIGTVLAIDTSIADGVKYATSDGDETVLGAVFNDKFESAGNAIDIAGLGQLCLTGICNVKVWGAVNTGDYLIADGTNAGYAKAAADKYAVGVFGQARETIGATGLIEAEIWSPTVGQLWKYIAGVYRTTIADAPVTVDGTLTGLENLIITDTSSTGSAFAGDLVLGSDNPADATNPLTMISLDGSVPAALYKVRTAADGAVILAAKGRGTWGAVSPPADNDVVGGMGFVVYDGTNFDSYAAKILVECDGIPAPNNTPGRISFLTTPTGSPTAVRRWSVSQSGKMTSGYRAAQNTEGAEMLGLWPVTAVGGGISYNMLIGNGNNSIGDAVGMRWQAGSAPGSNRAKGLIVYESTTTYGRGSFKVYQDTAGDISPVTNADTLVLEIKNSGAIEAGVSIKAGDYYSGDGTQGITQSETGVDTFDIVIKDGLITNFTKLS